MKFSDAILLGSTILRPTPHNVYQTRWEESGFVESGCAIGMALKSVGSFIKAPTELWPWLGRIKEFPCGCLGHALTAEQLVMHIFDNHVFNRCDWTLEKLVDWVRSVEPCEEDAKAPCSRTITQWQECFEILEFKRAHERRRA